MKHCCEAVFGFFGSDQHHPRLCFIHQLCGGKKTTLSSNLSSQINKIVYSEFKMKYEICYDLRGDKTLNSDCFQCTARNHELYS